MKEIATYTALVVLFLIGFGTCLVAGFVDDYGIAFGPAWVSVSTWDFVSTGVFLFGVFLISVSIATILTRMGM